MIDSLEIGKAIKQFLLQDELVSGYIKNKIYPIVADQGTSLPFIVYRRDGFALSDSKDRAVYSQVAMVTLIVAARSYKESVEIAVAIKDCLNHKRGQFDNLKINQIDLTNSYEDYATEQDLFIQSLTFKIEII